MNTEQKTKKKPQMPELLAPAGSPQALKAAILGGADAIYLAGKRFGARAFAANFDETSLRWARRVTKALNKKLYITLNTLVFDEEWRLLTEALDLYESIQPDALIIQDLGVAAELKRRKSQIPLHLSTQGAWFGQGGAEELKELGITRIILPRELTAQEIKATVGSSDLELEIFVHGAMCYSISGRCYWSIALGTRSGNRGTCAQPCRKEYSLAKGKGAEFAFSPKDLKLVHQIKEIAETGVASIKIEGRMKSPEYVYRVVSEYRRALNLSSLGNHQELSRVFTRGFSEGFFAGVPRPELWQTSKGSGREAQVVGVTTGKLADGLVEIELQNKQQVFPGDGLAWIKDGQEKGAKITWVKQEKKKKKQPHNTAWVRGLPTNLGAKTTLTKTSNHDETNWESAWKKDWERLPIDLYWSGHNQAPLAVEAIVNEHKLRLETDELLAPALSRDLKDGPLQEKFAVLGDLHKAGKHITTMLGHQLHISTSALKRLKRALLAAIAQLEHLPPPVAHPLPIVGRMAAIASKEEPQSFHHLLAPKLKAPQIKIKLYNLDFPFTKGLPADSWVLPWHSNSSSRQKAKNLLGADKISFWLPPILNTQQFEAIKKDLATLKSGDFLCFGWEAFALAKLFPRLTFAFDWTFNIANLRALNHLHQAGLTAVLSKEWQDHKIPQNLAAHRLTKPYNPLVSFSRFPVAINPGETATNAHKDRFFMLPLGNGVEGLFLRDLPATLSPLKPAPYQLEVAIPKNQDPAQAHKDLSRILN